MTTIILLLGGIVVVGAAMAAELLRLSRTPRQGLNAAELRRELAKPVAYRPMARLFGSEDFEFVASRAGRGALLTPAV